jgi:polysaccharide biosynthesis protein VpsQ
MFAIVITMLIVLADTRHLGFLNRVYDCPYGDKAGHFLLFGFLTLLVNPAVSEARPQADRRELAIGTSLVLAALIGMEEYSQRWFPSRTSSALDLAASYAGVITFTWLALRIERRKRNSRKPAE